LALPGFSHEAFVVEVPPTFRFPAGQAEFGHQPRHGVLPDLPTGRPQLERRTQDYIRNGITSLFAAFNITDGTVIGELHPGLLHSRVIPGHSRNPTRAS